MDVGTRIANEFYRVYDVETKEVLASLIKTREDADREARRIKNSTHQDRTLFVVRVTEVIYVEMKILA